MGEKPQPLDGDAMDTTSNDENKASSGSSLAEKLQKAEQAAARAAARVARLKNQERQALVSQAILVGIVVISEANQSSDVAAWLIQTIDAKVTKPAELKRLEPLLNSLKATLPPSAGGEE